MLIHVIDIYHRHRPTHIYIYIYIIIKQRLKRKYRYNIHRVETEILLYFVPDECSKYQVAVRLFLRCPSMGLSTAAVLDALWLRIDTVDRVCQCLCG